MCSVSVEVVAVAAVDVSTGVGAPLADLLNREVKVVDRREGALRGSRERAMGWSLLGDVARGGSARLDV